MKNLFNTVEERRSIRRFKSEPISKEQVEAVLETARLAPSWCNLQCWRFLVIDDTDVIKSLGKPVCETAPVVIVACGIKTASGDRTGKQYYMFDMGIAVEHMALAAEAMGLGTCIVGWFDEELVKSSLGIPAGYEVVALLPLGIPDEAPEARPRKSMEEIACWGTWSF